MSVVYINLHPTYDYSIAVISGFVELRQFVADNDFMSWDYVPKGGLRRLMIRKTDPNNIEKFIEFVQRAGCEVKIRDERNNEWSSYERPSEKKDPQR